jgi:hypothetical protein
MISTRSSLVRVTAMLAVGIALVATWSRYAEAERRVVAAQNDAMAEGVIRSIAARLPPGTSESDVIAYLRAHHPGYSTRRGDTSTRYLIDVGEEPSEFWGCGLATASVELLIEQARLVRTSTTRWSTDCM